MDRPKQIFIVDEDSNLLYSLAMILTRSGYFVVTAGSVKEMGARLQEASYDLAIIDFQITGYDGMKILEQPRRLSPESKILIFTTYTTESDIHEAILAGAYDILIKPADPDMLLARIQACLEQTPDIAPIENYYLEITRKQAQGWVIRC